MQPPESKPWEVIEHELDQKFAELIQYVRSSSPKTLDRLIYSNHAGIASVILFSIQTKALPEGVMQPLDYEIGLTVRTLANYLVQMNIDDPLTAIAALQDIRHLILEQMPK